MTPTLTSIANFRDFGGYVARDGRLRRGQLFRSAHHGHADDADLTHLARLGIATIVDLRRPRERRNTPSRRWTGCTAEVIECDLDDFATEADDPYVQLLRRDLSEKGLDAFLIGFYREAPFERRHQVLFAAWFQALGTTEGALLVHCAGGKDRTGILVALTQMLLGVHRDDILADYLRSNDHVGFSAHADSYRNFIARHAGRIPTDAYMRRSMGVDAAYLDAMFAALAERHGSGETYLATILGVDPALRARIEAKLFE